MLLIRDNTVGQDYEIFASYVKSFIKKGKEVTINIFYSPLIHYNGYLLNYENPYGAGRIIFFDKR